jgi:opacity protein-like surface antigen
MKQLLFAGLVVLCCAPVVFAQTPAPEAYSKIEAFVGFSGNHFFYADSSTDIVNQNNLASNFSHRSQGPIGFETSLTGNLNGFWRIKGDFSMYFNNKPTGQITTGQDFQVDSRSLYLMAGPEIKARNHTRLAPFAHALFGLDRSRSEFKVPSTGFSDAHTRTGFAMAFGGGLDVRLSGKFSIRSMIDYTPTFLGNADPSESGRQNHFRVSLGILVH